MPSKQVLKVLKQKKAFKDNFARNWALGSVGIAGLAIGGGLLDQRRVTKRKKKFESYKKTHPGKYANMNRNTPGFDYDSFVLKRLKNQPGWGAEVKRIKAKRRVK